MSKKKLTKNKLIFFMLYISIVICILLFTLNLEILIIPYIIFLSILFININLDKKNNNEISNDEVKIETKINNNGTSNDEIKIEIKNKINLILDIILNIILIIPIFSMFSIGLFCPICLWMLFLNPISILMIIIYLFVLYSNLSRLYKKIFN